MQWILGAILTVALGMSAGAQDEVSSDSSDVGTNGPPPWEVTADVGFTLTSGNSETLLATAALVGRREWTKSRVELGLSGAYGEEATSKAPAAIELPETETFTFDDTVEIISDERGVRIARGEEAD